MSEYKRNIIPVNQRVEKKYVAGLSEDILINYFRQVVDSNPYSEPSDRKKLADLHSAIREHDRLKAKSLLKGEKNGE